MNLLKNVVILSVFDLDNVFFTYKWGRIGPGYLMTNKLSRAGENKA